MTNDFLARASRMAAAIETAMPKITDMWGSFPYAEQPGDDEAMTELRRAAADWREYERAMMHDTKEARVSDWSTTETQRGFPAHEFLDSYGWSVRLQESSNMEPHIWIFPEVRVVDGRPMSGAHLTPEMARDVAARLLAWAAEHTSKMEPGQ